MALGMVSNLPVNKDPPMTQATAPAALTVGLFGLHAADQLALTALPLIATLAFGAGPAAIRALVAAQGAAWLLVALPAGVLVDRAPRARVLRAAGLATALLCLVAMAAPGAGWLALAAFCAASAVVTSVGATMQVAAFCVRPQGALAGRGAGGLARATGGGLARRTWFPRVIAGAAGLGFAAFACPAGPRASVQPLTRRVRQHDLVAADHVQQRPGALIELVALDMVAAQAQHPALDGVACGFRARQIDSSEGYFLGPLRMGDQPALAMACVPAEIEADGDEGERQERFLRPSLQCLAETPEHAQPPLP